MFFVPFFSTDTYLRVLKNRKLKQKKVAPNDTCDRIRFSADINHSSCCVESDT